MALRSPIFSAADLAGLWSDHPYYAEEYTEPAPTPELVAEVERELGVRLPAAYVELAQHRNGGGLARDACPSPEPTSWAEDRVGVTGIFAIGRTSRCSLLGEAGQELWVHEWEYPRIGVYFADCPSAGHDMIALDYRACWPEGEPTVVHVDQERDYAVTELAPSFEEFIRRLGPEAAYDD